MRKIKTHCREGKKKKKEFTDDIDIDQRVQFMERDGECERMFEKLHHHIQKSTSMRCYCEAKWNLINIQLKRRLN